MAVPEKEGVQLCFTTFQLHTTIIIQCSMASPFPAQQGTNYCPKDKELLKIQTLLVILALQLKTLDNEIAEL
jgi:hypothetical protein